VVQISSACVAAPDRNPGDRLDLNEDLVLTGSDFAVVLDGATAPKQVQSGCRHTVAWLVGQLAAQLAVPLLSRSAEPLADLLAEAIAGVCQGHKDTCDLANPDSPSSTVSMVRALDDRVDHLVLADSPVVLRHRDGRIEPVVDSRIEQVPEYTFEAVRRLRNRPGGFWVASTEPNAAYEALAGSTERIDLDVVAIFSDGASRYAERYGHSWSDALALLENEGPAALIQQVREADAAALAGTFRGKRYDDASAVLLRF
jgi:hypothetical protein